MNKNISTHTIAAEKIIKSPDKRKKLLDAVVRLSTSPNRSWQFSAISGKIFALVRMIKCYTKKEYVDVPWQTIVLITATFIYFVSPFDAIPDIIPFIGFSDDIAIISALFTSITQDVDKFIAWETAKSTDKPATDSSLADNQ
jgi:uncharacterized membrane protein YkvA (DUF1232 family)